MISFLKDDIVVNGANWNVKCIDLGSVVAKYGVRARYANRALLTDIDFLLVTGASRIGENS